MAFLSGRRGIEKRAAPRGRPGRTEEEEMKVEVDQLKCGTAGICVQICPQVFRFHEGSKKAYAPVAEVPALYQEECLEAAKKCPKEAIVITY